MTLRTMKAFTSLLAFCLLVATASATPQGEEPQPTAIDAPTPSLTLEVRCGRMAAVWGEVPIEGPYGKAVVAPIAKDGSARIDGLPPGWVRIRKVQAGPIGTSPDSTAWSGERSWCLDVIRAGYGTEPLAVSVEKDMTYPRYPSYD